MVNADDQHHIACTAELKTLREPLATVWPALTKAMYLLADFPIGQDAIWEMVGRGALQLRPLDTTDVPRIRELMHKYANRPMDLADAALIRVAEREGLRKIFTVDRRDFSVYRLHGRVRPTLIP
jgi:uncharacterized protein